MAIIVVSSLLFGELLEGQAPDLRLHTTVPGAYSTDVSVNGLKRFFKNDL